MPDKESEDFAKVKVWVQDLLDFLVESRAEVFSPTAIITDVLDSVLHQVDDVLLQRLKKSLESATSLFEATEQVGIS